MDPTSDDPISVTTYVRGTPSDVPRMRAFGLTGGENLCFFNTAIQLLLSFSQVRERILEAARRPDTAPRTLENDLLRGLFRIAIAADDEPETVRAASVMAARAEFRRAYTAFYLHTTAGGREKVGGEQGATDEVITYTLDALNRWIGHLFDTRHRKVYKIPPHRTATPHGWSRLCPGGPSNPTVVVGYATAIGNSVLGDTPPVDPIQYSSALRIARAFVKGPHCPRCDRNTSGQCSSCPPGQFKDLTLGEIIAGVGVVGAADSDDSVDDSGAPLVTTHGYVCGEFECPDRGIFHRAVAPCIETMALIMASEAFIVKMPVYKLGQSMTPTYTPSMLFFKDKDSEMYRHYRLVAVSKHDGGLSGGHYYAEVLRHSDTVQSGFCTISDGSVLPMGRFQTVTTGIYQACYEFIALVDTAHRAEAIAAANETAGVIRERLAVARRTPVAQRTPLAQPAGAIDMKSFTRNLEFLDLV